MLLCSISSFFLLSQILPSTRGFGPEFDVTSRPRVSVLRSSTRWATADEDGSGASCSDDEHDHNHALFSRRKALQTAALLTSSALLPAPARASGDGAQLLTQKTPSTASYYLDCLQDLPSFDPSTTVRLYLSRHGETENNRLNRLQGARIDAPINNTGERQAARLGQALSRAQVPPSLVLHSPLQRAQQTAQIAARQINNNSNSASQQQQSQQQPSLITLKPLDSLAELDFGEAAEGEPVQARRAQRLSTYAAWATGNLDTRMSTGGESGREMLLRIEGALQTMVKVASETETGCIAAVAHSAYLRMLLATVSDISFLSAYQIRQNNCCVNVLDFQRGAAVNQHRGSSSSLLLSMPGGAPVSSLPLELSLPAGGRVERINETRHLGSIEYA